MKVHALRWERKPWIFKYCTMKPIVRKVVRHAEIGGLNETNGQQRRRRCKPLELMPDDRETATQQLYRKPGASNV